MDAILPRLVGTFLSFRNFCASKKTYLSNNNGFKWALYDALSDVKNKDDFVDAAFAAAMEPCSEAGLPLELSDAERNFLGNLKKKKGHRDKCIALHFHILKEYPGLGVELNKQVFKSEEIKEIFVFETESPHTDGPLASPPTQDAVSDLAVAASEPGRSPCIPTNRGPSPQPRLTPPRQTGRDYHFASLSSHSASKSLTIKDKPAFELNLPTRSSQFYHYTSHTIKILGRKAEQDALERFRDAGPGFRWWQIAGVAGQGKSRLAVDLVLKTQEKMPGWEAGFLVDDTALSAFAKAITDWAPKRPHLIVIDYILARIAPLKIAIQTLKARNDEFNVPICLLLVERQPWNFGGFGELSSGRADWFCRLAGASTGEDAELDKLRFQDVEKSSFHELIELEALNPDQLAELVAQIATKHELSIAESPEIIKTILAHIDDQGRPLYAYFLAMALRQNQVEVAKNAESLLDWVLQNDRHRRWRTEFKEDFDPPGVGSDAPNLEHYTGANPSMRLALLATIMGKLDCNAIPNDLSWATYNREILRQALIIADNSIEDDPEPEIYGLQPDLLGEWFVLRSIDRKRAFLGLFALTWRLAPDETSEFLLRASRDFPTRDAVYQILKAVPSKRDARRAYEKNAAEIISNLHRVNGHFPTETVLMLKYAAKAGDSRAMNALGYCYQVGNGVKRRMATALRWYRKGAAANHDGAMFNIGACYLNGDGVKRNLNKAFYWFHKAEESGNGAAMFNIGVRYLRGDGVTPSNALALEWFHKSAAAGYGGAMSNIGVAYLRGDDEGYSPDTALVWFRNGAAAGDGDAMFNLGLSYQNGIGVRQDLETALVWFSKGAAAGSSDAREALASLSFMLGRDLADLKSSNNAPSPHLNLGADWVDKPSIPGGWYTPTESYHLVSRMVFAALQEGLGEAFSETTITAIRSVDISFYPGMRLVDFQLVTGAFSTPCIASVLVSKTSALFLNGTVERLNALNIMYLSINGSDAAKDYFRFHCAFVYGTRKPIQVIEDYTELQFLDEGALDEFSNIASSISQVEIVPLLDGAKYRKIRATVLHDNALYDARFHLTPDGEMENTDNYLIAENLPVVQRQYFGVFRTPPIHSNKNRLGVARIVRALWSKIVVRLLPSAGKAKPTDGPTTRSDYKQAKPD